MYLLTRAPVGATRLLAVEARLEFRAERLDVGLRLRPNPLTRGFRCVADLAGLGLRGLARCRAGLLRLVLRAARMCARLSGAARVLGFCRGRFERGFCLVVDSVERCLRVGIDLLDGGLELLPRCLALSAQLRLCRLAVSLELRLRGLAIGLQLRLRRVTVGLQLRLRRLALSLKLRLRLLASLGPVGR